MSRSYCERGASLVGVLEAEHEGAARLAREEVVEERRPGRADVQRAGRAGRDAAARPHRSASSPCLPGRRPSRSCCGFLRGDLAGFRAGHDLRAAIAPRASRGQLGIAAPEVATRRHRPGGAAGAAEDIEVDDWLGRQIAGRASIGRAFRMRRAGASGRPRRRRCPLAVLPSPAWPELLPPGHVVRPTRSWSVAPGAGGAVAGAHGSVSVVARPGCAARSDVGADRVAWRGPTRGAAPGRRAAGRPPARPGSAARHRSRGRDGSAWPASDGQP